jgi:hypothetical protein
VGSLFHRSRRSKAPERAPGGASPTIGAQQPPQSPFAIDIPYSPGQVDGSVPDSGDLSSMKPLVTELIEIGRREGFVGSPNGTYDEHWNHKGAREIGALLNDQGGMQLMLAAHEQVATALGASPRGRELVACWGGVGH